MAGDFGDGGVQPVGERCGPSSNMPTVWTGHMISGSHDKMPNHHFYCQDRVRTDPNSPVQPRLRLVFDYSDTAAICLGPLTCGMRYDQYVR